MKANMIYPAEKFVYNNLIFDLKFPDRVTFVPFLCGESNTESSCLVEALSSRKNMRVMHFDLSSKAITVKSFITGTRGNLIIISDADIVLNDELRSLIEHDLNNQYLIFGKDISGLGLVKSSIVDIDIHGNTVNFTEELQVELDIQSRV